MAIATGKITVPKFYRDFAKDRVLNYGGDANPVMFARASTATYYNQNGILVTASINKPRFDYDPKTTQSLGLLTEETRTNTATYNTQIGLPGTYTVVGSASVTMSLPSSPDGTNTATLIDLGSNSVANYVYGSAATTALLTGSSYTYSIFVKQGTAPDFAFTIDENSFGGQRFRFIYTFATKAMVSNSTFQVISNGYITDSSSIELPNGWVRLTGTFVTSTGSITGQPIDMIARYGTPGSVYVWGRQLEKGYFPTSFIYNTGSGDVTRAVDSAYISSSVTLMAPNKQHTFFAEFKGGKESNQRGYARFIALGGNELIGTEGYNYAIGIWNGNTNINVYTSNNFYTTFGKAATSYNESTLEVTLTSTGQINKSTLSSLGTWNQNLYNVYLGSTGGNTNTSNGYLKRVMYYNTLLDPNYMLFLTR